MIKRTIGAKISEQARHYPVLALIGPRQTGKTTLVKKIFADKDYVNLEDLEQRSFAQNDPKGFLAMYPNGAIIDEIQKVPDLLSYIQVIVDEKKQNGMFILTGSQNFLLMEKATQSLAGRVAIFTLLPLSLYEVSPYRLLKNSLSETMFTGLYPKLFDDPEMDVSSYYSNYVQTYVERDVRLITNITDLSLFRKFLILCAARTGQLLNITSLANDTGISHQTAKNWLSLLETAFIIYLLRPHHKNLGKRVVKTPKLYFYDTGLLCSLLNIENVAQLDTHHLRGSIFESLVITEIIKLRLNRSLNPNVFFWRDKTGNEVDVLLEDGDKVVPVEIKSGQTVVDDYFKGIEYYRRLNNANIKRSVVVYGGDRWQKRKETDVFGWKHLARDSFLKTILPA